MSNKSKKGFNGQPQARDRRQRVISYLENQLKAGKHTIKDNSVVELTDKDVERIKKELSTLKNRI
jgi:hypothetical protein